MAEAPVVPPVAPPAPPVDGAAPPAVVPPSPAAGVVPPPDPTAPPKTELAKPAEPAAKPAEAPAPFDAAKLTLPEGMKADDLTFKTFTEVFTDDKLDPQARGQKLIDIYTGAVKGMHEAQVAAWNTTNENWVKAVRADPEIGGAHFEPTKATIAKAIDSLGTELSVAFRQGLDATGAGNHPAIWKGLAKMASLFTEGGHVQGTPPKAAPDIGASFFPNSKMTKA